MKRLYQWLLLIGIFACLATELRADELAIQKFMRDYVEAFNRQDLEAVAGMWTEKGTHVDRETGERTEGRAAIRTDLSEVFKAASKTRLAGSLARIRLIKPDVAAIEGTTTTTVAGDDPDVSQFSAILVKQGEKWQIESLDEMPLAQPVSAAAALRELAWLEGNWIDESKESAVVSSFRWSANRTFLIRSFSTKEGTDTIPLGTQIIGWDPRSKQIRSWTFNFDGSFGDGVWSKNGSDWLIKSSQALADGRAASGTYVLTPVNKDAFKLRIIGHEVEGESLPNSPPASITRVVEAAKPATNSIQPLK